MSVENGVSKSTFKWKCDKAVKLVKSPEKVRFMINRNGKTFVTLNQKIKKLKSIIDLGLARKFNAVVLWL